MSKPPYNHNLVDTSKAIIASVDFETLDIHPTAVITGLGAVIEGPRRRWTTSHFPISAHDQFGRTMSADTVTFWRTRYDNDLRLAFENSMAGKGITLRDALDAFLKQCEAAIQYHDKVAGPGHSIYWIYKPAIFDGALLYHACCYFGDAWEKRLDAISGGPYRRHALDLNSMQFLANMVGVQVPEFPKPGKLHDPTSDADAQLKAFRLVQAALKAQVTNTVAVGPVTKPEPRYSGALPPKAQAAAGAGATPPAPGPAKPKTIFITGQGVEEFVAARPADPDAQAAIETVVRDVITGKSIPREGPRVLKIHNGIDDLDDDGPTVVYQGQDVNKVLSGMLKKGEVASTYEFVDEAAGSWPSEGAGDGTPDKPHDKYAHACQAGAEAMAIIEDFTARQRSGQIHDKYAGKPEHAAAGWQPS